jgi:purine nucleosidase
MTTTFSTTPRNIIIDTDPGQDDAVAILLALASPELNVLGITAVAGNVPLALTTRNICQVLELAGRTDVPVYAGAAQPLKRKLVTAEHVHGSTGLDGPTLPEPTMQLQSGEAADFIVRSVREHPAGSITLCALGPLTNVALALHRAPDIAARIREIVLMGGGCFEGGNITPAAEFNMYVDPHAAKQLLASGVPVVMMPLDVTHQVLTTTARVAALRAIGTRCAMAVADMLGFSERFDVEKYGTDGGPLHDPCVVAYLLQPTLFSGRLVNVEVETASELTMGMTVADWWRVSGRTANALFIKNVDADGFYLLLNERMARLP